MKSVILNQCFRFVKCFQTVLQGGEVPGNQKGLYSIFVAGVNDELYLQSTAGHRNDRLQFGPKDSPCINY